MTKFLYPVRVYYEDTDSGGVVYYANYLKFMERCRTELLRSHGFEQDRLIEEQGILFAVRSLQVDYMKPARFNELLQVSAKVTKRGKASLTFVQEIKREHDEVLLCTAIVRIACIDARTFKPKPIPQAILTEIPSEC